MSHYRANATAPQFSTALRNVGTGAALDLRSLAMNFVRHAG